jgi:tetratricopeptide (TPR) repeat protein
LWVGLIGISATIPFVQPNIAVAKTSIEIAETAKAITVLIAEPDSVGSGVILQQQGDTYTVLTAAHVVKNSAKFKITTPDDRKYEVISNSIRRAPGSIDLAVIQFKSTTKYPTAKLGNCNVLKSGMDLYVGGFPGTSRAITESIFVFREGKVSANSNKVLENGYSLVYSNDTLPGMSGGAVLNADGELVAIHGRGDRDDSGAKTGFNLGIPVNRLATVATKMGVELGGQVAPILQNTAPKADDYIALGVQKYKKQDIQGALADYNRAIQLNPNSAVAYNYRGLLKKNKLQDIQSALADYNRAIQLDPNFALTYSNRGFLKEDKLQDIQGALADYNRAMQLNPNFALAYNNRGLLKANKLRDIQGALADYNRAIQLDPNLALTYSNRGVLKENKLQDIQGALADYNRAIQLNPNFAGAYGWRGKLKYTRLNDRSGAIVDIQQAAKLFQQQGNTQYYQQAIDYLKKIESNNSSPISNDSSNANSTYSQIATSPNNAEHYYSQGDKKADASNYREAIIDFDRAISLNSQYVRAYVGRGRSKYELKDYPGAIFDYKQAISIDPQYASAYFNLALVKAKSNDLKGAISDMQQAVKLYQQQGKQQDVKDAMVELKKWQQPLKNSGF